MKQLVNGLKPSKEASSLTNANESIVRDNPSSVVLSGNTAGDTKEEWVLTSYGRTVDRLTSDNRQRK